jgi:hypothetical protein
MRKLIQTLALTAAFVAVSGTAALAEQRSVSAVMPWDGHGEIFHVAPGEILFQGSLEGIMYAQTGEGELDEAFVVCPVTQRLNTEEKTTRAVGHCMITVSGGDTVFGDFTCDGRIGLCAGQMNLTAGSGEFEGITGTGDLLIRSPLRALVSELGSGSAVSVATGIAILPELRFEIPAK